MIYDCLLFFNELDLLEIKLNAQDQFIDKFVIVEANRTHSGMPRELCFEKNTNRFSKFLHKIIYLVVENLSESNSPWENVKEQRNAPLKYINFKPNDVILLTDVDEILNSNAIKSEAHCLELNLCYYYFNYISNFTKWTDVPVFTFKEMFEDFMWMREYLPPNMNAAGKIAKSAGWHFSYCGGPKKVAEKIKSFYHQEYNNTYYTDLNRAKDLIYKGWDIFDRPGNFVYKEIDSSYPKYIIENKKKFEDLGYIAKKKFSIIIPTFNHCEDLLKPCIESIKKNTSLNQVEIIVVANGCVDNTKEYVENLGDPFKLLWFDNPLGYTIAANEGIKVAKGDFVILLNNDVILLDAAVDAWINLLYEPFEAEEKVGITGPGTSWCPYSNQEILVFFCVMIKKEIFNKIGLLDPIFSPGYGEDADFCARIKQIGYKMIQVPGDKLKNNGKLSIGSFPIYHASGKSFGDNIDEILEKNRKYLTLRYNTPIKKLNLGCGGKHKEGYINIDLEEPADIIWDIRKLNLFLDNSIDEIYASHIIEHISPFEVSEVLQEWNRILKPAGILVIDTPNMKEVSKEFENADRKRRYELLSIIYGLATPAYPHLYGWDSELLIDHLYDAGFDNFEVNEYQDSWVPTWVPTLRVLCKKIRREV